MILTPTILPLQSPSFYKELKMVGIADLCSPSIQACKFVPSETFELCIPSEDVCKAINETCEITRLMKLMTSKIADGFDLQ